MDIEAILNRRADASETQAPPVPVIISSRVRLARNLAEFPFPGWAKEAQRREVLAACRDAAVRLPQMDGGHSLEIDELNELEKQVLVERHLISRELSNSSRGSGVIISADQTSSIMINEEDHMRIQVVLGGLHFKKIWNSIDSIDTALETDLDLAFSSELGYLTACPTNLGTGLRASVMMHLPGLVLASQMEKVIRAVNQLGIAVRGLFGEGSDASGSIFQISNQQTLGESEGDIVKRLSSVLNTILEQEDNARQRLLENDPEKLFDKMGRSYGTLRHGHVLSSAEAMNCLSLIRLAVDFKLLPDENRNLVDRLFIECQPGHVQHATRQKVESRGRDIQRARILREAVAPLPALDFDNLSN